MRFWLVRCFIRKNYKNTLNCWQNSQRFHCGRVLSFNLHFRHPNQMICGAHFVVHWMLRFFLYNHFKWLFYLEQFNFPNNKKKQQHMKLGTNIHAHQTYFMQTGIFNADLLWHTLDSVAFDISVIQTIANKHWNEMKNVKTKGEFILFWICFHQNLYCLSYQNWYDKSASQAISSIFANVFIYRFTFTLENVGATTDSNWYFLPCRFATLTIDT